MSYIETFKQLDTLLTQCQKYWQLVAFEQTTFPWPELEQVLLDLDESELAELEKDPQKLIDFFTPLMPELAGIEALLNVEKLEQIGRAHV